MAFGALNEEIAFPGGVVGGGDGEGVEMPAPNVVRDTVAIEMGMQIMAQRSGIQQRSRIASSENGSKGEIRDPSDGIPGLRQNIAAKDVGGPEARPKAGQDLGCGNKIVATCGEARTVDYGTPRGIV